MEHTDTRSLKRVYLAGFDVFRRDAIEQGERLKQLCARHGLQGLYPIDNKLPDGLTSYQAAHYIYENNVQLIRESDAVLANLNTFRGHEPDSGTVFEVGFATALRIPVWAYFDPHIPLREQIQHDEKGYDSQGHQVEDFGLPRNLMLACSWIGASHNAEDAVRALSRYLFQADTPSR